MIKNEANKQRGGFLGMLLGTDIRAGEGMIRSGQDF